jgi:hypothetical protein
VLRGNWQATQRYDPTRQSMPVLACSPRVKLQFAVVPAFRLFVGYLLVHRFPERKLPGFAQTQAR